MQGFERELLQVIGVLIAIVPAAIIAASVYLWRWRRRKTILSRAERWPAADATVNNSYEVDDNAGLASRNVLTAIDESFEYVSVWLTAIQYSYYVNDEAYAGTYCLPEISSDGHAAAKAGRAWIGRRIVVRYNPDKVEESVFLEQDGAPGKSRISRQISDQPSLTTLSLR